ncbi:hypothetical protein GGR51DRAFT_521676 [Nemania sp. FL0031]|nr:hypothetical protein GGR51DRAFT_521676 [Nemania sp. FL0031]
MAVTEGHLSSSKYLPCLWRILSITYSHTLLDSEVISLAIKHALLIIEDTITTYLLTYLLLTYLRLLTYLLTHAVAPILCQLQMDMASQFINKLRARWAGLRGPVYSLAPVLRRFPRPHVIEKWRFSQSRILRYCAGAHDSRRWGLKGPVQLQARIYGTVFMSIGLLVLNEELDWKTRVSQAVRVVHDITSKENASDKFRKCFFTWAELLAAYSGEVLGLYSCPILDGSGWGSELQLDILTTSDPEVEGGALVLGVAFVWDWALHNHPENGGLDDAVLTLIPEVEKVANSLPESPKVRGGLVILEHTGEWKSFYWDGKRWIKILFLEWQSPESIRQNMVPRKSRKDSDEDGSVD